MLLGPGAGLWQNRAMPRASLAVLCSVLVAGVAGCGGGGHGGGSPGLAAVTQAAYVTGQVPGYRFQLTSRTADINHTFTLSGSGAISERGSEGSMTLQANGKTIDELIRTPYIYIKVPGGANTSVTHGKPWVRADLGIFSQSLGGGSPLGGGSTSPTQTLGFLKAAGSVTTIGHESVRGVPSTHYHAIVDVDRYSSAVAAKLRAGARQYAETFKRMTGGSSLPIDVWIDGQSHVRRMSLAFRLCSAEGKIDESLSMDLYNYGPQAVIVPPPSSQVTDISGKLKSELAQSVQQLHC
jgi:hypothetical protein